MMNYVCTTHTETYYIRVFETVAEQYTFDAQFGVEIRLLFRFVSSGGSKAAEFETAMYNKCTTAVLCFLLKPSRCDF